jgi:putative heme-binding domain-containing protein
LRSQTFVIPPKLKFFLCGHLGLPTNPPIEQNFVQLLLADTNRSIKKVLPPRHDTAQRIEWDLAEYAGKQGYLEVVDQIDLSGYAWLAVARFEPPIVQVPEKSPSSIVDRQVAAATLVAAFKLTELRPQLLRLATDSQADWRVRQAAVQSSLADSPRSLLAAACTVLVEASVDTGLREEIASAVIDQSAENDEKLLIRIMQSAPARELRQVADALAATSAGSATLLQLVERGQAAARLLQDQAIRQKLNASGIQDLAIRVRKLTAALPPLNAEVQRLIEERRRTFRGAAADTVRGQEHFRKHCAACHQVQGQGALVGPQLDGIGNRGVDRVIEDVLDPNRNVDATFHVSVLTLNNGRVVSGLVRREEGENLILADQQGKEFAVRRSDIDERSLTSTSLMPGNVNEILQIDQFHDLVAYLISLRAKPSEVLR